MTGGLRRAALGYAFPERLADRYTIVAPDYPPLDPFADFDIGLSAILDTEHIDRYHLAGQSYGGVLAQPFLARHPRAVDRLTLSNSGPADYGDGWLPVEYAAIALIHLLPRALLNGILLTGLTKAITTDPAQRTAWMAALREIVEHDVTRADMVSHFAVAADIIASGLIHPSSYTGWDGPVVVLTALDDPTQSGRDIARYARLFARTVHVIGMGHVGHYAALTNPARYATWIDRALTAPAGQLRTPPQRNIAGRAGPERLERVPR